MAMVAGHCRPTIGFKYSSHTCDAQTSIACFAPSKKKGGSFYPCHPCFSSPFLYSVCSPCKRPGRVCVCIWLTALPCWRSPAPMHLAHCAWQRCALSPSPPSLPSSPSPHCDLPPPTRRPFVPATSLVFKRVDDVHNWHPPLHGDDCLFHSWCYLLIFGGCTVMTCF
jgi:hypothetical protein